MVIQTDSYEHESSRHSDSEVPENSDSDMSQSESLDSSGSRKRRKLSPPNINAPILRSGIVLSRVNERTTERTAQKPITAPVEAQTTFESINVKPWLVASLKAMKIHRPTTIQKSCIPEILKGKDCIGGSRTGSGKTVAFAVPILQKWAEDPMGIFALVLTPTRELACQIHEQFQTIGAPQGIKVILVHGGVDMRQQAIALRTTPHVVIATPGRLADHIRTSGEETIAALRRVRIVVLDEADRLLIPGERENGSMMPDVEECLEILPPPTSRQTLLFTATLTDEVRALKQAPRKPGKPPCFICEINLDSLAIPASLKQMHLQVPVQLREHYLHMFLLTEKNVSKSVIIFCNTNKTAEYLHHLLRLLDHRVTALQAGLPQRERTGNLARFRANVARILVATDVAARGLDIPEVALVINFDVPRDPDDYIHRVGRTARAGRKGEAVTFVGQRDVQLVLAIENRVGRQMVAWEEEGANLETRLLREGMKIVGEKKMEAWLEIEEGKDVSGKRKRALKKMVR